jgi:chromosome partitioning protein
MMKSIAIVNFKGGVGKTTITWLLAKYAAEMKGKAVLVVDTDAQMNLTLAVQLQEAGAKYGEFEEWYEKQHQKENRTILDALKRYRSLKEGDFDFSIDSSFIYQMGSNLHFIPSVVNLYWLERDVFEQDRMRHFIKALLGEIENSSAFNYDYVLFDCPAYFTSLAYSVLSSSSLILIPVNPDVFASRGVEIMVDGLIERIQPWSKPEIAVFMNKARLYMGNPTRETARWWADIKYICAKKQDEGVSIHAWDSYIPEREDIKRAIQGGYFPTEFEEHFSLLWNNVEKNSE